MNWLYHNIKKYLYETVHVADCTMEEMAEDIVQIFEEYEAEYKNKEKRNA